MKLVDKISALFRRRNQPKPRLNVGQTRRGVAAGDLKKPDLSLENIEKWEDIPPDQGENFIYDQMPLFVHSTNVSMAQYFIDEKKLMLEFKNGSAYLYSNISEHEALQFLQAASKGGWSWDTLRIRGTKYGHKKPYVKIR